MIYIYIIARRSLSLLRWQQNRILVLTILVVDGNLRIFFNIYSTLFLMLCQILNIKNQRLLVNTEKQSIFVVKLKNRLVSSQGSCFNM